MILKCSKNSLAKSHSKAQQHLLQNGVLSKHNSTQDLKLTCGYNCYVQFISF